MIRAKPRKMCRTNSSPPQTTRHFQIESSNCADSKQRPQRPDFGQVRNLTYGPNPFPDRLVRARFQFSFRLSPAGLVRREPSSEADAASRDRQTFRALSKNPSRLRTDFATYDKTSGGVLKTLIEIPLSVGAKRSLEVRSLAASHISRLYWAEPVPKSSSWTTPLEHKSSTSL